MAGSADVFPLHGRFQGLCNRLHLRSQIRTRSSVFILVIFFAVFVVIVLKKFKQSERSAKRIPVTFFPQGKAQTTPLSVGTKILKPISSPVDAVWQPVESTRYRFYVFSAYVERRTVDAVRVIAATRTRTPNRVFCRLWLPDNRTVTLIARVKVIRENWNFKFSAAFVICLLRDSGVMPQETIGAAVSVIDSFAASNTPTNLLTVLDTEPKIGIKDTIHICVKPLHYSFGRNDWTIEWIEFNRLLGVSHFYVYNKSASKNFLCTLNYYVKQGLVTLITWKMPFLSQVEIKTEGQFAAYNDCLYRSSAVAGWLLPIDIDELVLPRREQTLIALLNSLSSSFAPQSKIPGGYLFRNTFFYLQWEDDPKAPVRTMTALKTRRKTKVNMLRYRSKYAVRPRDAVELGNHFLWEHAPGACSVGVPADRALLHHYRVNCEYENDDCLNSTSQVDRTAHKWSEQLMRRIVAVKQELSKVCPDVV